MTTAANKRGLGRGLDALLGSAGIVAAPTEQKTSQAGLQKLALDQIRPCPFQPRKQIEQGALEELAQSIKVHGVMQPVVVRKMADHYELIAGERRWRAAQLLGLDSIPIDIKNVPDSAVVAMALIENIQRENLNPIEEAEALQRLGQEFGLTHQKIAEVVGKSRTAITNLLRLMNLEPWVRQQLETQKIDMGHARALLGLSGEDQVRLAQQVIDKQLSVRETERAVQHGQTEKHQPTVKQTKIIDSKTAALQSQFIEKLNMNVSVKSHANGKGKLVLRYDNLADLEAILQRIT